MNIIIDKDLKLEFVKKSHAEELFLLTDTNRKFLRKWLTWVDRTVSQKDTSAFINECIRKNKSKEEFQFIIKFKGKIAGVIGLAELSSFFNRAEIGYWLGEEYTGKGIMSKSCKAVVDYLFSKIKVSRVIIRCEVGNKPSRRVPERLGFFRQGVLKHDGRRNGKFVNHVQYSVYKDEWFRQKQ